MLDRGVVLVLYQVPLRTLVIITDLLNASTILYLYYYQGHQSKKMAELEVSNSAKETESLNDLLHKTNF
jgi:hypothetical protein